MRLRDCCRSLRSGSLESVSKMSLNDPRWGRESDSSEDEKRRSANDRSENADEAEGANRRPAEDEGRPSDRGERREDRRNVDGRSQEPDIDQLWDDFRNLWSDVLNGSRSRGAGRANDDARSKLKSRDDFSLDDEPQRGRDDERDERRASDRSVHERYAQPRHDDEADERFSRYDDRDGGRSGGSGGGAGGGRPRFTMRFPQAPRGGKGQNFGLGILALCVVLGWAASGFYIVPEGQTGVETTFGRYTDSTMPGFHWRFPAPIQDMQLVDVSSVRTAAIGARASNDRLREALMLTDDENIVDVQFAVQYRIKTGEGARDYLFNTRAPDMSVTQAAESAMREVVGRKAMDSVLFESKAEIAEAVKTSMQQMLDRYGTGIEVMSVAIQNAQPPQQVQAAFNDAVKAGQDRERSINLGEAYMNAVIPKAQGTAARLKEEAEGYKSRVTEVARGDADRFASVLTEYEKAPVVTRDRLYVDAMRDVFSNVSKVYVDQQSGSSLLYLPLDKIVASTQAAAKTAAEESEAAQSAAAAQSGSAQTTAGASSGAAGQPAGTSNTNGAVYSTEPLDDIRSGMRARIR